MTCKNQECEHEPTLEQKLIRKRTQGEIRYGMLWEEIELPKVLKGDEKQ